MKRVVFFLPFGLLVLAVALIAFRQGVQRANLSETEVINHYAARYVTNGPSGAKPTDCAAKPGGADSVWLVINCGGAAHTVQFRVDHSGNLVTGTGEGPQT